MSHEVGAPLHGLTLYDSALAATERESVFRAGRVPVAVYGLGKMGLPIAAVFAEVTGAVTGVDIDATVIDRLRAGETRIQHEPGLPSLVADLVDTDRLAATTDSETAATAASVHVVVVPTGVSDGEPDLSALESAITAIGRGLDAGDIVLVESTVPPGTCRKLVQPTLVETSGLAPDAFGLAFCPERTASGRALTDIRGAYPKIVGGRDPESVRTARAIYRTITSNEVIIAPSLTSAECVKVFEGVYRDVNIALANQLALLVNDLEVDIIRAIELANTQPFCDIHDPGAGVGGHCIPNYPYFLTATVQSDLSLLETARTVNDRMPRVASERLVTELSSVGVPITDATVLVLGLAYRPGVPETANSPAIPIAEDLTARGATVYGTDPVVEDTDAFDLTMVGLADLADLSLDGVILVTAHPEFQAIDWGMFTELVVVDGRDVLDLSGTGHNHYVIGRGRSSNQPT